MSRNNANIPIAVPVTSNTEANNSQVIPTAIPVATGNADTILVNAELAEDGAEISEGVRHNLVAGPNTTAVVGGRTLTNISIYGPPSTRNLGR